MWTYGFVDRGVPMVKIKRKQVWLIMTLRQYAYIKTSSPLGERKASLLLKKISDASRITHVIAGGKVSGSETTLKERS